MALGQVMSTKALPTRAGLKMLKPRPPKSIFEMATATKEPMTGI
jgi:hypothetical protein